MFLNTCFYKHLYLEKKPQAKPKNVLEMKEIGYGKRLFGIPFYTFVLLHIFILFYATSVTVIHYMKLEHYRFNTEAFILVTGKDPLGHWATSLQLQEIT